MSKCLFDRAHLPEYMCVHVCACVRVQRYVTISNIIRLYFINYIILSCIVQFLNSCCPCCNGANHLFREFMSYIQRYKSFFSMLPEVLCDNEMGLDEYTCWNGEDVVERYDVGPLIPTYGSFIIIFIIHFIPQHCWLVRRSWSIFNSSSDSISG